MRFLTPLLPLLPLLLLLGCQKRPTSQAPLSTMQQAAGFLATGSSVARMVQAQAIQEDKLDACLAWGATAEVAEVAAAVLASGGDSYPAISVDLSACVGPAEPVELPILEAAVGLVLQQMGLLLASNGASCEVSAAIEYVEGTVNALFTDGPQEGRVEIPAVGICAED